MDIARIISQLDYDTLDRVLGVISVELGNKVRHIELPEMSDNEYYQNDRVNAVKLYRKRTLLGLREAMEAWRRYDMQDCNKAYLPVTR